MATSTKKILEMIELLPKDEQTLIEEFVKRVIIAWDPDFTKLTPKEIEILKTSEEQVENGEVYSYEEALKILDITEEELSIDE